MAVEFSVDQTVFYGPRSSLKYRTVEGRPARRYILWPAYVYRVWGQRPSEEVNAFQKAVLSFCQMDKRQPSEIARLLQLDPVFIAWVQQELVSRDLIDKNHCITDNGRQVLRGEIGIPSQMTAGYVFQDPWNGSLWPRFMTHLPYVNVKSTSGNSAKLILGTQGKPKDVHAWVKSIRVDPPLLPSPHDIIDAILRHQQSLNRQNEFLPPSDDETEADFTGAQITKSRLSRVEIISEYPQPVYLATCVYSSEEIKHKDQWHVCDPFSLGDSKRLYDAIKNHITSDSLLKKFIVNFSNRFCQIDEDDKNSLDSVQDKLVKVFGDQVKIWPFYDRLVYLERSYFRLQNGNSERDAQENIMINAGKALESCFDYISSRYPVTKQTLSLYKSPDSEHRREILEIVAKSIGFDTPIPEYLIFTTPKYIHERAGGSLSERMLKILLAAWRQEKHPLRKAAQKMPNLLSKLKEVRDLRNQGAHATQEPITDTMVEKQYQMVCDIIEAMLCNDAQA